MSSKLLSGKKRRNTSLFLLKTNSGTVLPAKELWPRYMLYRAGSRKGRRVYLSFVMPSTYSMESLPKPNSDKVTIKEVAEKEFIVIRFSGLHSAANLADQEKLLLKHVAENKIKTVGLAKYAFYNPPWTLPFLRRNEIMIEIESQK